MAFIKIFFLLLKIFEKVEKTGIISTKFSFWCTPSVILGSQYNLSRGNFVEFLVTFAFSLRLTAYSKATAGLKPHFTSKPKNLWGHISQRLKHKKLCHDCNQRHNYKKSAVICVKGILDFFSLMCCTEEVVLATKYINPNWHEQGTFTPLVILGLYLVCWISIKNFQSFLEVKIDINWVNLTPCQAHWVLQNLLLGFPKDERFSYFHSSCQLELTPLA